MPGLDGFATASIMRQRVESSETPIIFITGEDIDRTRLEQAYGLGAVDILIKPFEPHVLRSKVALFAELFRLRGQTRALRRSRDEHREGVRTREEWLAMVAHDLRQPLAATSLSVAAILRNSSEAEVERMRRHYAIIQRALMHMERMVGDLLDISRLESGTFAVELAPSSMADILHQAAELCRRLPQNVAFGWKWLKFLRPASCTAGETGSCRSCRTSSGTRSSFHRPADASWWAAKSRRRRSSSSCATRDLEFPRSTCPTSSTSIGEENDPETGWDSDFPSFEASSRPMAEGFGSRAPRNEAARSISPCPWSTSLASA
jgi:CheY-like chemotaxis protein